MEGNYYPFFFFICYIQLYLCFENLAAFKKDSANRNLLLFQFPGVYVSTLFSSTNKDEKEKSARLGFRGKSDDLLIWEQCHSDGKLECTLHCKSLNLKEVFYRLIVDVR